MESKEGSQSAACIEMHSLAFLQVREMNGELLSLSFHSKFDQRRGGELEELLQKVERRLLSIGSHGALLGLFHLDITTLAW